LMISQSFLAAAPFLMKTFRPSIHPSATHKGQYLRGLLNGMIITSPPAEFETDTISSIKSLVVVIIPLESVLVF
jgi:hypothetical protein